MLGSMFIAALTRTAEVRFYRIDACDNDAKRTAIALCYLNRLTNSMYPLILDAPQSRVMPNTHPL